MKQRQTSARVDIINNMLTILILWQNLAKETYQLPRGHRYRIFAAGGLRRTRREIANWPNLGGAA